LEKEQTISVSELRHYWPYWEAAAIIGSECVNGFR